MTLSRRQFLLRAAAASGAAAAGGGLEGCAPDLGPAPYADAPAPVDGRIALPLAAYPDLARDGGAIIVRAPGAPQVLVARTPAGGFAATGAICTHQGCPVGVDGGEIVCPCHLSRFAFDGTLLHPPAKAGLPTYGASYDDATETVTVDLRAGDPGFPVVEDGALRLEFVRFPQLLTPGGSVAGRPAGHGRPIAVIALPGGAFAALDTVCTHLQCTVAFDAGAGRFFCPCHDSSFATDGSVVSPPATLPLAVFAVAADGAGVTVSIP